MALCARCHATHVERPGLECRYCQRKTEAEQERRSRAALRRIGDLWARGLETAWWAE